MYICICAYIYLFICIYEYVFINIFFIHTKNTPRYRQRITHTRTHMNKYTQTQTLIARTTCASYPGFHSVLQVVRRVIDSRRAGNEALALRWVDVGPSMSPAVEEVKRKLGFSITDAWATPECCDYTGDFIDCCSTRLSDD